MTQDPEYQPGKLQDSGTGAINTFEGEVFKPEGINLRPVYDQFLAHFPEGFTQESVEFNALFDIWEKTYFERLEIPARLEHLEYLQTFSNLDERKRGQRLSAAFSELRVAENRLAGAQSRIDKGKPSNRYQAACETFEAYWRQMVSASKQDSRVPRTSVTSEHDVLATDFLKDAMTVFVRRAEAKNAGQS